MKHSKSSLFLMEVIIALLFFSLASTVCIRLFVKSHTLSRDTQNLNYAVTQSQNLAEAFIGVDGDMEQLQSLFPGSHLRNENQSLTVSEGDYTSTLTYTKQICDCINPIGSNISADIAVYYSDGEQPIYTLHVEHHIAEGMVPNE
ncbi:MAG: hypothetical protein IJN16_07605 [Lachnospiraceae bacterium]|nr:hypothetical protein [Lachnospiraceae bacterium]